MAIKTEIKTKITFEEMNKVEEQLIERAQNYTSMENIICPRCGGEMNYDERGNSYIVTCETPHCISYGIRGL